MDNQSKFSDIPQNEIGSVGGIRLDLCKDYIAQKAVSDPGAVAPLDEFGIFHCKDDRQLSILVKSVNDYVSMRKNDTEALSKCPDAATVLNGSVVVCGNYVIYTFLPNNGNSQFQSVVASLLTK